MKALKWLDDHLEEVLLALLLIGISSIMVIQVIARYVFNNSLTWSDELARFLLVWSCFLSTSFCIKKGISISIDQLQNACPGIIPNIIRMLSFCIITVYSLVMIPYAWTYVMQSIASGAVSSALRLPMYYIQSGPLVGFVLTAIRSIQCAFTEFGVITSGNKNEERRSDR